MIGQSTTTFSKPSNAIAAAKSSASPDIITLTDCIDTLFRAGRYQNMDKVFAEAVDRGIVLRGNRLDSQWETDLSGMSIPVATGAARYILNQLRSSVNKPTTDLQDMSFITGVGRFHRNAPKAASMSLRDFLQSMLETEFKMESYIPPRAKGTVVIKKEALARWIGQ